MGSTKIAHSTYWLGQNWLKTMPHSDSPEYLMRLSSIRRSTGDFVKIVTGKDIPVKFSSGQQSYTDGQDVVVISAVTDPNDIDVSVGLALHEGSHVLLSQPLFQWLRNWHTSGSSVNMAMQAEATRLQHANPAVSLTKAQVDSLVHHTINLLEDRRIDSWMYERIGGYRPYYDSLYEFYLGREPYTSMRQSPTVRVPTIKNYEFWVILTLTGWNDDLTVLPDLDKIVKLADVANIRRFDKNDCYKTVPAIVQTALDIAEIIVRNSQSLNNPNQPQQNQQAQPSQGGRGEPEDTPWGELDNLDTGDAGDEQDADGDEDTASPAKKRGRPTKAEQDAKASKPLTDKQIEDAVEQLERFVDGQIEKKDLSQKKAAMLDLLERSGAKVVTTGNDGNVPRVDTVVYHNCTESVIKHHSFPFGGSHANDLSRNAVTAGLRLGAILANRIKVMQDEWQLKVTRQSHGRLDKRMISSLGFGNETVFAINQTIRHKPVFVHLTIDASSSMHNEERWGNALKLAVALAVAASKTRTMDVAISLRAGTYSGLSGEQSAVAVVYDSRKDDISKIKNAFGHLHTAGSTPEGLAFQAILNQLVLTNSDQRKFFINISDGEPAFNRYSGETAVNHTRQQVQAIRNSGVKVLSYFVGGHYGTDDFRKMYGRDAAIIDPNSIAQIASTLNKLFFQE
jgi:hypothetical protein